MRLRPARRRSQAAPGPAGAWWGRPDVRVGAITAGLALTAAATLSPRLAGGLPPLRPLAPLLVLVVLFAVAEKFVVTFPVRRGSHSFSLSEIPLVLGLVLLDPVLLVGARVAGALAGLTIFRRQGGGKLAFNVALFATQAAVAALVFHAVAGGADPLGPRGWAGAFVATFAADLVSIVAVTAAIAVHDDSAEWGRLLTADIKGLLQLPLVAVSTTLALVTALLVRHMPPAGILLAVLSFATYRAFRRYAQQTQGHEQVEQLYAFTRALGDSRDTAAVTRTVLARVRDLVRAESAELILHPGGTGGPVHRIRMHGREQVEEVRETTPGDDWWAPAARGEVVLRPAGPDHPDGMAVPVPLDGTTGVLAVTGSLPDLVTFAAGQLRLLEALAAHTAVALTNVHLLDRLRHIGLHDALTGLPNRRHLHDAVQDAVGALGRTDVAAVLMLDLDRFQEINDALGHDVGDDLLRQVGQRLEAGLGGRGLVARLGGDEFAILLRREPSAAEVLAVANEVRRTVELPVPVGSLTLTVQASIGVCFAPEHGRDADRLLQRADVAMYAAKDGRGGVRVYEPEADRNTVRRLALMADLRTAVAEGSLDVAYQPKIAPRTGQVLGAEALVRWNHAGGPVPPDEFVPLAERSGLIRPLTHHVLHAALGEVSGWRRRTGLPLTVAVNLSPVVLADRALAGQVGEALARHGLPPGALTLEITENAVIADPRRSLGTLDALHRLGVILSIDDFGTGHSSLGRLAELPIQEVKIDKSFVRDIEVHRSRRAVTDAALQLGRALDLVVVAEGIETEAEYAYLRRHGCDAVQGYLISRPLPAADFLRWLQAHVDAPPAWACTR